jgi:hypothetical protein
MYGSERVITRQQVAKHKIPVTTKGTPEELFNVVSSMRAAWSYERQWIREFQE